ncbi:MAG: hypothetical protein MUP22_01845, partial [Desulfobacterales bacterium]|nr:hypothetical protein [Desulfobacterales bacterium]
ISNFFKHKKIDRYNPEVVSVEDIHDIVKCVECKDEKGIYRVAIKDIEIKSSKGIISGRRITRISLYRWQNILFGLDLLKGDPPPQPDLKLKKPEREHDGEAARLDTILRQGVRYSVTHKMSRWVD